LRHKFANTFTGTPDYRLIQSILVIKMVKYCSLGDTGSFSYFTDRHAIHAFIGK